MPTDVRFEDEDNQVSTIAIVRQPATGIIAWLIESGIAKNARIAEQILMYVALLAVAVGIVAPFVLKGGDHQVSPAERARLELLLPNPKPPQL